MQQTKQIYPKSFLLEVRPFPLVVRQLHLLEYLVPPSGRLARGAWQSPALIRGQAPAEAATVSTPAMGLEIEF